MPFYGTTVLDFWWCLLWVSKPEWAVYMYLVEAYICTFTFGVTPADLLAASCCSPYVHFKRGRMLEPKGRPSAKQSSALTTRPLATDLCSSMMLHATIPMYMCHGLSLLEMHLGGNDQRPWCRPTSLGVLGARWTNTIYYWGRLRLAAPMGGSPCSISTPTLVGSQCIGAQLTKLLGEKYSYSPWAVLT